MVRIQLSVLAIFLLASVSEAIKGGKLRKLVDSPIQTVSALPKGGAGPSTVGKQEKAGPSLAGASVVKAAGGCKKKSVPLKKSPGSKAVKSEEDDLVPYCASKVSKKVRNKEDCDNLRVGKLPKHNRKIDGGVGVQFKYDESAQNPQEFRQKAEKTAKKAGPKAAGCLDTPIPVRFLAENDAVNDDDVVAISGVEFKTFEWSDDCDPTKEDCDTVIADVSVFYEGKRSATEEEAREMMTTVVETVVAEDYGDAEVDIYWLDLNGENIEIENGGGGGTKTAGTAIGSAAGGLVGVAAVAAGSFFGLKWYRNRASGGEGEGDNVAISNFYRS